MSLSLSSVSEKVSPAEPLLKLAYTRPYALPDSVISALLNPDSSTGKAAIPNAAQPATVAQNRSPVA